VDFLKPTNLMVRNLVVLQDSYINTYSPDFRKNINSIVKDILGPEVDEESKDKEGEVKNEREEKRMVV
jgi:hypothetical protein